MKVSKRFWFMAVMLLGIFIGGCGQNHWAPAPVPADTTAPTVSSTNPANSATAVAINSKVAATFSKTMDPSTLTGSNFTLKSGGASVACTMSYVGLVGTLTPKSNLAANTTYVATITTGAKDTVGNALGAEKTWSFTTSAAADTTAPTVLTTVNADGATGVAINTQVGATFSEDMDPETITASTFTFKQGTTNVPGDLSFSGANLVFVPTSNLAASTLYTATITTGVKDLAGNAMAAVKTWSFTTSAVADTTAPSVTSTIPANLATDVYIGSDIIANFSKDMNATTINTTSFTLTQGGATVPSVVSYTNKIATLNPISDLSSNTLYVATVTTVVKDLAGNSMAANKVWSFRTAAAGVPAGPAAVNLGIASDYVILGKTGIDTTGTTKIYGNIGVSPAAATGITGFALVPDASNVFSTSIYVSAPGAFAASTGKVYAANYAAPTPADMTAAISAIEAAYTDATGRSDAAIVNIGAGLLGGLTLAPGLYTFDTNILIPTDLTLAGGANDVWIFKTTGSIILSSATQVILSGGAKADNIYWAAADYVELGTTSNMKGNIIGQTRIDLLTGASLTGRLLAQTAVNLQAATVTKP